MNDYRWDQKRPNPCVPFAETATQIADRVKRGESVLILGGHGMGKSVLLREALRILEQQEDVLIVDVERPAAEPTIVGVVKAIAEDLGCAPDPQARIGRVLDAWRATRDEHRNLVLVFDDLGGMLHEASDLPGVLSFFNSLEKARGTAEGRIGVLGAGGGDLYALEPALGSPFATRAATHAMRAFDDDDINALIEKGGLREKPRPDDAAAAIRLLTGGHPAVTMFVLHHLDNTALQSAQDWTRIAAEGINDFLRHHRYFVHRVHQQLRTTDNARGPEAIWHYLRRTPAGEDGYPVLDLQRVLDDAGDERPLRRVLEVLQASALTDGCTHNDTTADVRVIHSLFSLPPMPDRRPSLDLRERLRLDLEATLVRLHRSGPAWFYDAKTKRQLVEEATFTAHIGSLLEAVGWERSHNETLQGNGRVDLWVTHPDHRGKHAIVEVKRWQNREDLPEQLHGQRTTDTAAMASVVVCPNQTFPLPDEHCQRFSIVRDPALDQSDVGWFRCTSPTDPVIDHYLVAVRKGRP
jgi:energy-coupling factor transporter ATP-binding protein EcfA2